MELKGRLFGVRFEPPRGEFRERRKLGLHARLLNDYVLGAFLVSGAWRVGKDVRSGQRFLAAAGPSCAVWRTTAFSSRFTAIKSG